MGLMKWDARASAGATRDDPSNAAPSRLPRTLRAGVLRAIGNTPLVRLERLLPGARYELYAKLEALNPGGSIKPVPVPALAQALSNSVATMVSDDARGRGVGMVVDDFLPVG
jgi:hypothetical protein